MTCSRVDPRSLLTPLRLDIAIKARFFQHLAAGGDPDAERLYRWHIETRTGGREPGGSKLSTDDYVSSCAALLASMRGRGFDPEYPIIIGSNGRLKAGAHRLACALVVGCGVVFQTDRKPSTAQNWGAVWLMNSGISPDDLVRVEKDWERLAA